MRLESSSSCIVGQAPGQGHLVRGMPGVQDTAGMLDLAALGRGDALQTLRQQVTSCICRASLRHSCASVGGACHNEDSKC